MMNSELPRFHCLRCHHTWIPRFDNAPTRCPKKGCGSKYWNREYTRGDLITRRVLDRLSKCPFQICQQRYEYMSIEFTFSPEEIKRVKALEKPLPRKRKRKPKPKYKALHNKSEVTRSNNPFVPKRRIKSTNPCH